MTCFNEDLTDRQIKILLAGLALCSFPSLVDGCRIVSVDCERCGWTFQDEYKDAREKVLSRAPFLCLSCDGKAVEVAFWGIRIRLV